MSEYPTATCFWDANDREEGHDDIAYILDKYDPGDVVEIEHVAVIKTTFNAFLPEVDGGEQWTIEADTLEEAQEAVADEMDRRDKTAPSDFDQLTPDLL